MKTVRMFDCDIACINMEETIEEINNIIKKRIYTQHVVLNASKVVLLKKDNELKKIIQNCSFINADGQSIVWASKLLKLPIPERVAGIDLMEKLIHLSVNQNYRIYFFGAKEEVVNKIVQIYKETYPTIKIAGYRNGYFSELQNDEVVEDIKNSKADILFVAFSSPKKEYWLSEFGEKLNVPFVMGVGGSFDVISGVTKRAPLWMQKFGLEWLYRFCQEPKRMWKRYLIGNVGFIYYTIIEKIKREK